jgi:Methyltransferase domain
MRRPRSQRRLTLASSSMMGRACVRGRAGVRGRGSAALVLVTPGRGASAKPRSELPTLCYAHVLNMRHMPRLREKLTAARGITRTFMGDPVDLLVNVHERVAEREELGAKKAKGVGGFMPWPPCPYQVDADGERKLHDLVGAPWPCKQAEEFPSLWSEVMGSLEARGFELGRGAFGGWGDGEPGLVRAVWCLTRHLRPLQVVETGVARGITTRFILEALDRNGDGHLWSVDLPPPRAPELHSQVGVAVPGGCRRRWSYVRGSSRRRLPRLLAQLQRIDLFIHDSRHSERNLLFELDHAWGVLGSGGVLVADDVDLNCGFHVFRAAHPAYPSLVCHAEPVRPDAGRQDDRGVFGVVRKTVSASNGSRAA